MEMRNLLLPAADINKCDDLWIEDVWSGRDGIDKKKIVHLVYSASYCWKSILVSMLQ